MRAHSPRTARDGAPATGTPRRSPAKLTTELLREAKVHNKVTVASDGEEAMQLLRGTGGRTRFRPDLILLDLNLPRMSGHEVLEEVTNDPELVHIPVVVLTSAAAARIREMLDRRAAADSPC